MTKGPKLIRLMAGVLSFEHFYFCHGFVFRVFVFRIFDRIAGFSVKRELH